MISMPMISMPMISILMIGRHMIGKLMIGKLMIGTLTIPDRRGRMISTHTILMLSKSSLHPRKVESANVHGCGIKNPASLNI